jgi:hypothetical protein
LLSRRTGDRSREIKRIDDDGAARAFRALPFNKALLAP